MTVETGSLYCHPTTTWRIMEQVVMESPDMNWTTSAIWNQWANSPTMFAPQDLFKMKAHLFREYMEWMLPMAKKIEERLKKEMADSNSIKKDYGTAYQSRYMAFVLERLFSFWACSQFIGGVKIAGVKTEFHPEWKPITDIQERNTEVQH